MITAVTGNKEISERKASLKKRILKNPKTEKEMPHGPGPSSIQAL